MASQPVKGVVKQVKPLLSRNSLEAKRRVLSLYKAFCKIIPEAIITYNLPLPYAAVKQKIRSEFLKHKHITDLRVIDMLVIKGQKEYQEVHLKFKQRCQVLYPFKESHIPAPKDFLSKFINGTD